MSWTHELLVWQTGCARNSTRMFTAPNNTLILLQTPHIQDLYFLFRILRCPDNIIDISVQFSPHRSLKTGHDLHLRPWSFSSTRQSTVVPIRYPLAQAYIACVGSAVEMIQI